VLAAPSEALVQPVAEAVPGEGPPLPVAAEAAAASSSLVEDSKLGEDLHPGNHFRM